MQMTELFERFLAFEKLEIIKGRCIGGVPYWHLVRIPVFRRLLGEVLSLKPTHPDLSPLQVPKTKRQRIIGKIRGTWRRILDLTVCNLSLAVKERPILFSMTPRQAILDDGRKVSLLLDFFTPFLRSRYALLEYVFTEPVSHPFFRKVFHLPRMKGRFEKLRSSGWFADVVKQSRVHSKEISALLSAEFGRDVDAGFIAGQIADALLYREVYKPVFVNALLRMRVKVLVTAVHYNLLNYTLAEAAHELGMEVVELQHGTIYKAHVAYNLSDYERVYSPDYLVAWGEYWKRQTRNYPLKSAIAAGYPYMESMLSRYGSRGSVDGRRMVLFISQANIADRLVEAACKLRSRLPERDFRVVYKLHPNESRSWMSLYPKLTDCLVEVVPNDEKNIYACLAEANAVVGSCSTSLVEGVAWGLKPLVLHWLPGADTMQNFVDSGLMRYVEDDEGLVNALLDAGAEAAGGADLRRSLFAMPGAAMNVAAFLDGFVDGVIPQRG